MQKSLGLDQHLMSEKLLNRLLLLLKLAKALGSNLIIKSAT